jgi:hypothetical protein
MLMQTPQVNLSAEPQCVSGARDWSSQRDSFKRSALFALTAMAPGRLPSPCLKLTTAAPNKSCGVTTAKRDVFSRASHAPTSADLGLRWSYAHVTAASAARTPIRVQNQASGSEIPFVANMHASSSFVATRAR